MISGLGGTTKRLIPIVLGACLAACSEPVPQLTPPSAQPSTAPLLKADGLEEGTIEAFGLKLPARSTVKRSTHTTMVVEVPANTQRTLDYLTARLAKHEVETDPHKTVLEGVELAQAPGKKFRIVVKSTSMTTEVTVRREPDPQPASSAISIDEAFANDPRATPEAIASIKAAHPNAIPLRVVNTAAPELTPPAP